jgi:hypothetical protein
MNSDILWDVDYVCRGIDGLSELSNESEFIKILMYRYLTIKDIRGGGNLPWAYDCVHLEAIKGLINYPNVGNSYALGWACEFGCLKGVKFLIDYGLHEDDIRSKDNWALHRACENGHLKIVKFLMSYGLDVNDIRSNNNYALRWACDNDHLKVVKFLMSCGLNEDDIRTKNNWGLGWARYNGHSEVVEFLGDWIKSHSD